MSFGVQMKRKLVPERGTRGFVRNTMQIIRLVKKPKHENRQIVVQRVRERTRVANIFQIFLGDYRLGLRNFRLMHFSFLLLMGSFINPVIVVVTDVV